MWGATAAMACAAAKPPGPPPTITTSTLRLCTCMLSCSLDCRCICWLCQCFLKALFNLIVKRTTHTNRLCIDRVVCATTVVCRGQTLDRRAQKHLIISMFVIYHAVHTIAFVQIKDETSTARSLRTVPMRAHITVNGLDWSRSEAVDGAPDLCGQKSQCSCK
jgi:hypothetical protein